MNVLGKVFRALGGFFVKLFGKKQLQDLARAAEAILASDFGQVVMAVVESLQEIAASNGELARKEAFQRIEDAAIRAGKDVPHSIINLLIELAVQKLKGTFKEVPGVEKLEAPAPDGPQAA